jgi:hypothetical protein
MNGLSLPSFGWPLILGLLSLVVFVNVATEMDDARRLGVAAALRVVLTQEVSSVVSVVVAFPLIAVALSLSPPKSGLSLRFFATHIVASVIFSAVHVGLMSALRFAVLPAVGGVFRWSWRDAPYEYRKDLVTYVVVAALFWTLRQMFARASLKPAPTTFDIRDGASVLRVSPADILAAQAAGNYVEFLLADGRRPLMRTALAQVEAALSSSGFVRTHRSWLVNPGRMQALTAAGSGDYRLDLGGGLTAPVSRRYPEALARLRDGETNGLA